MSRKTTTSVLVIIILGIAILSAIVLPRLVNPESYRKLILQQAEDGLNGRKVELGEMSSTLWPGIGIKCDKLLISDLAPDAPPLLKAQSLVVRAEFFPLLSGRLVIKGIEIESPVIQLTRTGPDLWNISDLTGPAEGDSVEKTKDKETSENKGEVKKSKVELRMMTVTNAALRLEDKSVPDRAPLEVKVHSMDLKNLFSDRPMEIKLQAGLDNQPGSIEINGSLGPVTDSGDWEKLEADVKSNLDDLNLALLEPWVPPGTMPIKILGALISGTIEFNGKADKDLNAKADLTIEEFRYTDPKNEWPVGDPATIKVSAEVGFDRGQDMLVVESASLVLAGSEIKVTAKYKGLISQEGKLDATVKAESLNIEKLLDLIPVAKESVKESGLKTKGPFSMSLDVSNSSGGPNLMNVDIDMKTASLEVPGSFIKQKDQNARLSSGVKIDDKKIVLDKTRLLLGPLNMEGQGVINLDPNYTADINLDSGSADTDAVLAMFPSLSDYRLGGKVKLGLSLIGSLTKKELLELKIRNLQQTSDAASFGLDAKARLGSPMQINFSLKADSLNIDKIMAAPQSQTAKTTAGEGKTKHLRQAQNPKAL